VEDAGDHDDVRIDAVLDDVPLSPKRMKLAVIFLFPSP
jgi:hypothetical protein